MAPSGSKRPKLDKNLSSLFPPGTVLPPVLVESPSFIALLSFVALLSFCFLLSFFKLASCVSQLISVVLPPSGSVPFFVELFSFPPTCLLLLFLLSSKVQPISLVGSIISAPDLSLIISLSLRSSSLFSLASHSSRLFFMLFRALGTKQHKEQS